MKKKSNNSTEPRRRRQSSNEADWEGIDSDAIRQVIAAVTARGGAIRFGYSRDGGAYSIGIYGDGKPYTEFHPADEGVMEWLEGFTEDFR